MSSAGQPRILAGRYRLEQVIGRGGMSTVYRATDLSLDRTVAVKVALDPQAEENPVYVARFKREARAAAALNHSGAVTVFDAGADGPTRYIVMEFVDGRSLADILREQDPARPLEPRRAARIAEQIADTLVAAHAAGIVHRDIKPGNVMVEAADRVKVLDFGIARTSDAVALTRTASVLGTAPYMAPEQAMGNPADARSDIYSLGCVLFEMLTGEPPFMADVAAAVLHQHVHVQPKAPSERNPAVPPALDALVLEMLAKAPNDRPQTAAEVRDRLAAFETGARTGPTAPLTAATEVLAAAAADAAAVPQIATVQQTPTVPPDRVAATQTLPPSRPQSRGPWVFLAVIALLLLGAAVAYAVVGGSSSHSSSTPSRPTTPTSRSSRSATGSTSRSSSTPSSSTSSTPSSTSSSSTSTTTTTVTTTTTTPGTTTTTPGTTTTAPGATTPPPPGQGGAPPGQTKTGKNG